ncbi:MAG: glycosyltransferase, partial [Pyrinomonadaceae bacterium]
MKVLLILDSLNRGGSEMLALDVCRNAARHGVEITLVATGGGSLEKDFEASGVEYIRLQRRLPIDLRLVVSLRKIIRERVIDIVHADQAVSGLHIYLATIGTNVRRVLAFHGHTHDKKNRLVLKYLAPRMASNLIVSQALHKWLEDQAGVQLSKNVTVLYNGVDEARLVSISDYLRNELGLDSDALIFGMI